MFDFIAQRRFLFPFKKCIKIIALIPSQFLFCLSVGSRQCAHPSEGVDPAAQQYDQEVPPNAWIQGQSGTIAGDRMNYWHIYMHILLR